MLWIGETIRASKEAEMLVVMIKSRHRGALAVAFALLLAGGLALGVANGTLPFS